MDGPLYKTSMQKTWDQPDESKVQITPEGQRGYITHDLTQEADHLFKILLVGDSGVGKSALVSQFADKEFSPTFISTIGVDFNICTLRIGDKVVKLQIWDTAGQERFRAITSSYYRGAHGIILVHDVNDRTSFRSVPDLWIDETRRYAKADVQLILVGNKTDLVTWPGLDEEEKALAEKHCMMFGRTSAKTGDKVDEMFIGFAEHLMKNRVEAERIDEMTKTSQGLSEGSISFQKDGEKTCCFR